ncbi:MULTISPECIES: hypothetical protein [unclassified Agarivorans]|uniref:hypothetical protein n=1 Tax=unclassified Agarivorans TaxID=2636026 RepID=UPI0026E48FAA|nr:MULTISPECIES: hypothetical protein [unclassified Agarivorans]MDO6685419.1 hypothetical protein [Agarivorans sp. 3_MG-2023]MDO6715805.1 hypothetical protein [Agarivorans sp. 2_MG-2023]
MKYIILVVVVAGGIFLYSKKQPPTVVVSNHQELFLKLDSSSVSIDEVKEGAYSFSKFFCNDEEYQTSGGKSVTSCLAKYEDFKEMCADRIFPDSSASFSDKKQVMGLLSRYTKCVGAST